MAQIAARGIDTIKEKFPQLHVALKNMMNGVNTIGQVAGIGSYGPLAAPTAKGQLSVVAGAGIHDVAINDPSPQRGESYFLEWDTDPSFANGRTIALGPSRNWRGYLGSGSTVYWRYAKQMLGSDVSNWVNFGSANNPTGVQANGDEPAPQNSQGSGSSIAPGKGFGAIGA